VTDVPGTKMIVPRRVCKFETPKRGCQDWCRVRFQLLEDFREP